MKLNKQKFDFIALFVTAVCALLLGDWINSLEGVDLLRHILTLGVIIIALLVYLFVAKE